MSKRTTVLGRWDPEVLRKCKEVIGDDISTADISRMLYRNSMFRVEHKLGSLGNKGGRYNKKKGRGGKL